MAANEEPDERRGTDLAPLPNARNDGVGVDELTLRSSGTGAGYDVADRRWTWIVGVRFEGSVAIRAHVPLEVLSDTIQPYPSFSGIYDAVVMAFRMELAEMPRPVTPMDSQNGEPVRVRRTAGGDPVMARNTTPSEEP